MRLLIGLLAVLLAVAASAGGAATQPSPVSLPGVPSSDGFNLDQLLNRQPSAREDRVEIMAWIEPSADAAEVVIALTPIGRAKLVANPGITVTPVEPDHLAWRSPLPYRLVGDAQYFMEPAVVRLPLGEPTLGPIELDVAYAYCLVDAVCLFGEERVTATLR